MVFGMVWDAVLQQLNDLAVSGFDVPRLRTASDAGDAVVYDRVFVRLGLIRADSPVSDACLVSHI